MTTINALHEEISAGGVARIEALAAPVRPVAPRATPSDIAIVGLASILPGAKDARAFWANTLAGVDAISEVPADRWDWRLYYDADPKAPDKVVSKWGGFVPDVAFDPLRYGMPPSSLPSIEPVQLLVLEAVRAAIDDAGYADRPFGRERTSVILGMGGGAAQLAMGYAFRSYLPLLEAAAPETGRAARAVSDSLLPEWTEDSFPGFLLNVAAGRVANRFDLGGTNYTVDAACGSSLAAASLAVRELETGAADMVILGGADTVQNPLTYLAFSKTHAFSPRGRSRPFEATADGIVISEGVGVVVLKRLADAERDGDRIYAVIKGIGASSDGRARGLTAPNVEGQSRALRRAYEKAGVDPATIGYVEAHGTGTAVGDVVEVNALAGVLREAGAAEGSCAVGSGKSMIGHTKCAAGLAGLINATLALHHRTLPPTIGVERVNPRADLAGGPLRVSTAARPWFHAEIDRPRRAGVSAFGFGGTNFHAVLEAYDRDPSAAVEPAPRLEWPAELLVWRGDDLAARVDELASALASGAQPPLRDVARSLSSRFDADAVDQPTLAIVATSIDDLAEKLGVVRQALGQSQDSLRDPRGIEYRRRPEFARAQVAFLFPGQGAQALEMLGDVAMAFPEVRKAYESFDAALVAAGRPAVTPLVFPATTLDHAGRDRARQALTATEVAQPAVGAASVGMLGLLASLGMKADMVAGHSYGELVALHAAGCLDVAALAVLSEARGRLMRDAAGPNSGTMAALLAGLDVAREAVAGIDGVVVANLNGPAQTVISGPRDGVAQAVERVRSRGVRAVELSVACAFHSPAMVAAAAPLAEVARSALTSSPDRRVYANLDASVHPADPLVIAARLGEHAAAPVRFAPMIEAMHAAGARVFIEVGPGSALTAMTTAILGERPHLAASCDAPGRSGVATLLHTLARLIAEGVAVDPRRLTAGRDARLLDLANLPPGDGALAPSASTWLVNGSRARPIEGPEPKRLGQAGVAVAAPAANGEHAPERNGRHAPAAAKSNGVHELIRPEPPMPESPQSTESSPIASGSNGSRPLAPPPPRGDASSLRVMEAFQQTMRTFLDVQQATMLAYLNRREAPAPRVEPPLNGHAPTGAPAPPPGVKPAAAATNGKHVVAPAAPPPPPAPAPSAPSAVGREAIAKRLVEIVRDRTGYPAEMLKPGLDLEADLGIDSIKRVEILGTLRDGVDGLRGATDSALMDGLTRSRTLGEIVDRVDAFISGKRPASTPPPASVEPVAPSAPPAPSTVKRLTLEAVSAPLSDERGGLAAGVVVVVDDGRGIARAVKETLRSEGRTVELVTADRVDLSSPAAVETMLEGVRKQGPICGIVHASPLRASGPAGLDAAEWTRRIATEVKGLFLLARAAGADLEAAARRGGSTLVAATAMGGGFAAAGSDPLEFFPGHGGIAGLVKTLAREWAEVRVRVVDFDPGDAVETIAGRLAAEVLGDDGWPEVGYLGGKRIRLRATAAELDRSTQYIEIRPGEPVLVTGGARGITAATALELAKKWRPTLLLVGSSKLPLEVENAATAGLVASSELKAALHGRLRRDRRDVGPAELEAAYRSTLGDREIRAALRGMRDAGSIVEYAQADVRDPIALAAAIEAWRRRYGDPVGLIHGAGVIHDKLIGDKTPDSFDRVLSTKLDGALNLARILRPDVLRFAAFFSSVAGRFGNKGQADYAAANDALNKLAVWLDRRWPGRVASINWGPWSGVGMVSDLEGHLGRRGLEMIRPEIGCKAMLDEIAFGRKGDVEIVIAGKLGSLDAPRARLDPHEVAR